MATTHRPSPSRRSLSLLPCLLAVCAGLVATPLWAKQNGMSGYSGRLGATCGACHAPAPGNGLPPPPVIAPTPSVTISGPTSVSANTTNSYLVIMDGGVVPNGDGGINVAATAGQLIVTSPSDTQLLNGEIAHRPIPPFNNPKLVDAQGRIIWTFDWQAPAVNGAQTLYAAALSGNGDFGFYGDAVGVATLAINVAGGAAQPPAARPGGPYSGVVGTALVLNGGASSDGDGTIVSYSWEFGDGTVGTGATPSHVYTASGLYTVTLTVTDNSGLTASSTTTANVGTGTPPPPVIDGAALYANLCAGCHGAAPGTKAGRSAAAIQNAINTVPAMNTSAMRALTADEVQAISDAIALTGPQSPVAVPGGPYSGVAGTAVAFNGAGSSDPDGTIAAYNWIFGDGTTGTGATPSHVYTASGLYTVTLTVLDNSGASTTATTTANIGTGTPPPPVIDGAALYATNCAGCHGAAPGTKANRSTAQISSAITNVAAMQTPALQALSAAQVQAIADAIATTGPAPQPPVSVPGGPYTGVVNAAVGFTGGGSYDPDGTIVNYAWNFGDGTTGSGATPSHTYDASGLYTVSLTVTDSSGLTATATSTANIGTSTPPPPVIDGLALYGTYCASCHGAAPGSKANRTAAQIQSAITTVSAMTTPALQALTSTQLDAIAVAINTGGGTPPTPTTGQGLYEMYCLSCHGVAGSGGKVSGKSAGDIQKAIDDEKAMASLRGALSSAQVSAIASYLSGSGGSTGGTIPVGQLLYDTNCLACHDSKGGGGSGGKVSGASSSKISEAISKEKEMTFLKGTLTSTQIKYIADYLAGKSTPLVPAPSPTDGLGLYNTYCAGCHGAAPGTKAGRTSAQIAAAITSVGAMNTTTLRALNSTQVSAIAAAISTGGTPAPMPMPTTGQGLYEMYCLSCHGIRGGGGSGGNIRGDSASKIQEAIDKKKEMAHLRGLFTSDQLKKIADYIKN